MAEYIFKTAVGLLIRWDKKFTLGHFCSSPKYMEKIEKLFKNKIKQNDIVELKGEIKIANCTNKKK